MKRIMAIIAAVLVALTASVEGRAQFSKLKFGDYGVKSISPESFSAVKGAVWLEVSNPMEGFTVSEIRGMVYKNGAPFITGTASDFRVPFLTKFCSVISILPRELPGNSCEYQAINSFLTILLS